MYFEQFYLGCLAHASYMLASEGEAVVVDPQRDVEIYLTAAEANQVSIRHIFETHLHADFVSGHHELADRTGAAIYLGDGSGATFPHVAVHEGDEITTIEGLGQPDNLHAMQAAFVETDGYQCGYCTSGQIMSAVALLKEPIGPSEEDIKHAMAGNICRCGAYTNIVAAVKRVRAQA